MKKKSYFYIILSIFILWSERPNASAVAELDEPPPNKPQKVSIQLNLAGIKREIITSPDNLTPGSSTRWSYIEVLSSPRHKTGESPRDWNRPLTGTPRPEDQAKTCDHPKSLRKKSSVSQLDIETSAVASPHPPETPKQEGFIKPSEEKFQQGLMHQEEGNLEEALQFLKEACNLGHPQAPEKLGEVAYVYGRKLIKEANDKNYIHEYSHAQSLFKLADKHRFKAVREDLIQTSKMLGTWARDAYNYSRAKEFFTVGAERHDIDCLLMLGNLIKDKNLDTSFDTYPWTPLKMLQRSRFIGKS